MAHLDYQINKPYPDSPSSQ